MNHRHTGPEDEACPGCLDEADAGWRAERRKTVAGVLLLIALIIGGMIILSLYLSSHGSHF